MLKELVPEPMKCSPEARDVVIACLNGGLSKLHSHLEFMKLIASEANETCSKRKKQVISPEDVIGALEACDPFIWLMIRLWRWVFFLKSLRQFLRSKRLKQQ